MWKRGGSAGQYKGGDVETGELIGVGERRAVTYEASQQAEVPQEGHVGALNFLPVLVVFFLLDKLHVVPPLPQFSHDLSRYFSRGRCAVLRRRLWWVA